MGGSRSCNVTLYMYKQNNYVYRKNWGKMENFLRDYVTESRGYY